MFHTSLRHNIEVCIPWVERYNLIIYDIQVL